MSPTTNVSIAENEGSREQAADETGRLADALDEGEARYVLTNLGRRSVGLPQRYVELPLHEVQP